MSAETVLAIIGSIIISVTLLVVIYRKAPKRIKRIRYTRKWRDIQQLCAEKSNWPQAILLADLLLDDVLKRKNREGKTMGERMVSAQNDFTNNDAAWQAHKFANHIRHSPEKKLKEADVKSTLIGFRQALRDMGAL